MANAPAIETNQRQIVLHGLLIGAFVVALRLLYFGDPVVNIDEQFYLVVADKWFNHGLIPYVDIWDRKPVGIFLIYAPAVLWFNNAIVGYQVLGLIAVLATCAVVYRIGFWFGRPVALAAALFYAALMMLWNGTGGQTPVFYNLPVAAGAFLIMRAVRDEALPTPRVIAAFLAAAALFGLALQIKYICVLEICAISLIGLAALFSRKRVTAGTALALAAGMIVLGLAPTAAAAGVYAKLGHWHEFFFANFQSIFAKRVWRFTVGMYLLTVLSALVYGVKYWTLAGYGLRRGLGVEQPWLVGTLVAWLALATVGALSLGNPILHYFLPTAAPLGVLSAWGLAQFAERRSAVTGKPAFAPWLALVLAISSLAAGIISVQNKMRRGADQVYAVADYMNANLHGGCPYVFDDWPILYYLTHCNAPSIYTFPNHLIEAAEVHALEVDGLGELKRVLGATPPMIFVKRPFAPEFDADAVAMLEKTLAERYTLAKRFPAYRQELDLYEPR
jgi:hypothetical protein